jgi:hypothetical protein
VNRELKPAVEQGSASVQAETAVLDAVSGAIGRLRFGTVLVTVHEGKVVQLDITERRRFS